MRLGEEIIDSVPLDAGKLGKVHEREWQVQEVIKTLLETWKDRIESGTLEPEFFIRMEEDENL